jgi:CheY-like chemotaxis protein
MSHHILVVDDDAAIREMIKLVLESEDFSVATAANGREALDQIAANRPLLVLLDLQMPVMTGWETLAHLRAANTEVPVVFMTAGYRAKAEAERFGADGYVGKPFELDTLLGVVERLASTAH